jgi:hypothetical protein
MLDTYINVPNLILPLFFISNSPPVLNLLKLIKHTIINDKKTFNFFFAHFHSLLTRGNFFYKIIHNFTFYYIIRYISIFLKMCFLHAQIEMTKYYEIYCQNLIFPLQPSNRKSDLDLVVYNKNENYSTIGQLKKQFPQILSLYCCFNIRIV